MTTQPGAQVKSEYGCAKRKGVEGCDIAGILIGTPILLIGLFLLAINGANLTRGLNGTLEPAWILFFAWGVLFVLVSIGLFIPAELYEWCFTRVFGFATAVLASAVAVPFAVLAGSCALWLFSDPHDEWALLGMIFGAIALAGFGYASGCAIVLLKKLDPEKGQTAATIAAGIGVGGLNIMLMYLLHCSPFFD